MGVDELTGLLTHRVRAKVTGVPSFNRAQNTKQAYDSLHSATRQGLENLMKPGDFTSNAPGELIEVISLKGTKGYAFIPRPLPPQFPFTIEIISALERAASALGELNNLAKFNVGSSMLIQPFVRREALASSRIEGTQAEYDQLILFEEARRDGTGDADLEEVANYVRALESGWRRPPERPFSSGFMMELHQQLMDGVRGSKRNPGRLRSMDVLIGSQGDDFASARFVPPPAGEVRQLLDQLAQYIADDQQLPALIRLALVHYQFETIHPFEDGNGRLGRLILPLLLNAWGLLEQPLFYLSSYFEQNRTQYVDHLLGVSQRGEWSEWIGFVLLAVETQAKDAVARGQRLVSLRESLRSEYQSQRSSASILSIIDSLFHSPAITVARAMEVSGLGHTRSTSLLRILEEDGILREVSGGKRSLEFLAPPILDAIVSSAPEAR